MWWPPPVPPEKTSAEMAHFGLTRGAGGPHIRRQGRIRQVGPPNERVDRFIAAQTQKYNEEKAAELARKRETDKLLAGAEAPPQSQVPQQSQVSHGTQVTQRSAPRQPDGGEGIEAKIGKAHTMANTAHNLAASVRSDITKHIGTVEERFEAARARVAELESEVASLHDAAKDAWYSTFWMYADVVQNAAILDNIPGKKAKIIYIAEAPGTAVLFGEMEQTPEGPAMRCRWVNPEVGQLSSGWMLLRDAQGNKILTNFRLVY